MVYFISSNVDGKQPLLQPAGREVVIASIKWARDDGRIWVLGYVIIDNHFHFMFMLREEFTLAKVMSSLKRHTSREVNKLRQSEGQLWQEGYHDHAIRDNADFWNHLHYVHNNPVRRGWVAKAQDYPWSTAHATRQSDIEWEVLGPMGWSGEIG